MADRRTQLLAAIERLPLSDGADTIGAANVLTWTTYFAVVNELPRMRSSRRKDGAAKELLDFAKFAEKLAKRLAGMHREAINAISPAGERHALAVADDLVRMIEDARSAAAAAPPEEAQTSPRKLAPEQIAQVCGKIFLDLTRKRPVLHSDAYYGNRTGPFLRFVTEVFEIVGIDASAEHYAREAEKCGDMIGGNGGVTMRRIPQKEE